MAIVKRHRCCPTAGADRRDVTCGVWPDTLLLHITKGGKSVATEGVMTGQGNALG